MGRVEIDGETIRFDVLEQLYFIGSGRLTGDTARVAAALVACELDAHPDIKRMAAKKYGDLRFLGETPVDDVIDLAKFLVSHGWLTKDEQ